MDSLDSLQIALPPDVSAFVKQQMTAGGYDSATDYVVELIDSARRQKVLDEMKQLVLEGLKSEARPMTRQDWEDMRREVRERLAAERGE
jgi:Arc/MetJ-type ribon-helix-helix transcriptional regulator